MEYVEGRTLAQMLSRGPLPVRRRSRSHARSRRGSPRPTAGPDPPRPQDPERHGDPVRARQDPRLRPRQAPRTLGRGRLAHRRGRRSWAPATRCLPSRRRVARGRRALRPLLARACCSTRSARAVRRFAETARGQTLERVIAEVPPPASRPQFRPSRPAGGARGRAPGEGPGASARERRERRRAAAGDRESSTPRARWAPLAGRGVGVLVLAAHRRRHCALARARPPARPVAVLVQEPRVGAAPETSGPASPPSPLREADPARPHRPRRHRSRSGPSELPREPAVAAGDGSRGGRRRGGRAGPWTAGARPAACPCGASAAVTRASSRTRALRRLERARGLAGPQRARWPSTCARRSPITDRDRGSERRSR